MILEALKEQKTVAELSAKFGVHATQIQTWKRHYLANSTALFQESKPQEEVEAKISKLYEQIGKL